MKYDYTPDSHYHTFLSVKDWENVPFELRSERVQETEKNVGIIFGLSAMGFHAVTQHNSWTKLTKGGWGSSPPAPPRAVGSNGLRPLVYHHKRWMPQAKQDSVQKLVISNSGRARSYRTFGSDEWLLWFEALQLPRRHLVWYHSVFWKRINTFPPKFKKYILPTFYKGKCISEVVRIGSIIILHASASYEKPSSSYCVM